MHRSSTLLYRTTVPYLLQYLRCTEYEGTAVQSLLQGQRSFLANLACTGSNSEDRILEDTVRTQYFIISYLY
jgi:hypothetical protein